MKKTVITAIALAACVGTPLFAQTYNAKEDVMTFALTLQQQESVSATKGGINAGNWSSVPQYYKTMSSKVTQANIIQAVAVVLHGNAGYYGPKAVLELVQGELSGFFNVNQNLTGLVGTPQDNFDSFPATLADSTITDLAAKLGTGRHFATNPITGSWPPGHMQPWGQIFVKVPTSTGISLCENVTPFFAITVQECYDCYYLNSFISDATFSYTGTGNTIPPCCGVQENLAGNGKDRYYMTLSFDNTINNPYLNDQSPAWIGYSGGPYDGVVGLNPDPQVNNIPADGLTPDFLMYSDQIASGLGTRSPNLMRFTLNGIVTYTWSLKYINTSDVARDFVGTASYPAYGYGFVGLICGYMSGTASIAEKIVKITACCNDLPWYNNPTLLPAGGSWYGVGYDIQGNSSTRQTPVNITESLSYHTYWDGNYDPGYQWGSNPPGPTGADSGND